MEGNEDDDDVWDERSLKQLKRKLQNSTQKRVKSSNKNAKISKRLPKDVNEAQISSDSRTTQIGRKQKRKRADSSADSSGNQNAFENVRSRSTHLRSQCSSPVSNVKVTPQKEIMDGSCPKCQMPFSALIGQSPGWHVSECLETKYSYIGDCPEGIHCKSTFSPHYKRYSHNLLATTRSCGIFEKKDAGKSPQKDEVVETKIQSSRRLNFSGHDLSKPDESIIDKDSGLFKISNNLGDDSGEVKALEVCNNEYSSGSSSDSEQSHCKGHFNNDPCSNTADGVNVQTGHVSKKAKMYKGVITFSESSKTRDIDTHIKGAAREGQPDDSQNSNEYHFPHDSLNMQRSNLVESSNSCSLSTVHKPVSNVETEDFEMSSDDDLFGNPLVFESLCKSSDSLCRGMQNQGSDKHQQSLDFDEKQRQHLSQTVVSVKQENDSDATEIKFPMPSGKTRLQLDVKKEILSVQPSTSKKQQSLLSFATKSNMKTAETKPALKQTDIGVFFGLKPLTKPEDSKLTVPESGTKASSSSQLPSVSHRHGRWGGRKKHNQGDAKTVGYTSEGQSSGPGEDGTAAPQSRKSCPFYKKIPGSAITVDAFRYGDIPGCQAYFLSHFHYDHYGGLNGKFTNPVYCSKITANLVISKLYVKKQFVHPLPMNTPTVVQNVQVTLLEANHCPGAVMFLFKFSNGQTILHTGDFRASATMENYPELQRCKIDVLYLDTTYCDPEYSFPPQEETVNFAVTTAVKACKQNPKTLIVCGSYTIGKERVFLAIAEALGCKVSVEKQKKKVLDCLESDNIKSSITTDWKAGKVHVLPMAKLTLQSLTAYLESHKSQFTELLAFKPTGWEHSAKRDNLSMIKPSQRGNITVYGVPYSEHSSYRELERFVKFVRPQKIIPTVNNHSAESRAQMQAIFRDWLSQ